MKGRERFLAERRVCASRGKVDRVTSSMPLCGGRWLFGILELEKLGSFKIDSSPKEHANRMFKKTYILNVKSDIPFDFTDDKGK